MGENEKKNGCLKYIAEDVFRLRKPWFSSEE